MAMTPDPATFLPAEQDLPPGFNRVPDGERTDRLDDTVIKFRTFARDEAILSCGAYATPSDEVARMFYEQTRDNYASVGAAWNDVPDLGDEALSADVFPVAGAIQRIAVFRAGPITAMVQYTGPPGPVPLEEVVQLLRRMNQNGRPADQ
ncbi:MAG TPA: hypothetical protein VHX16_06015 [Chloroflexota bacterium]|nr:hypothetical protein [Chloroflexota bacterium]